MKEITEKISDKKIEGLMENGRFRQIPYKESLELYGTEKPDLRFEMQIKPVSELVGVSGFSVFEKAITDGGVVHALRAEGGAKFSRKEIDELTEIALAKGAKGLAYIVVGDELKSPILKFFKEGIVDALLQTVGAQKGDIIFFGAGDWETVCASLGAVRSECGTRLGLKDSKSAVWAWITDFPMYAYSEIEQGKIDFAHNPFSMPQGGLDALESKDPLDILAYQYDLTLNGFEVTSGAIRNHRPEVMYKAFEIAGYTKEQVDKRFGHMIRAFEYGAPPHGGNAPGIDRILMVLLDCESIRDIYAFPKDGQGRDVMLDAPSEVEQKQLDELRLKVVVD